MGHAPMTLGELKIRIQTIGPLAVTASGGSDRTPRGRKARGLLALLALSPNLSRTRTWLQDKLWSDRGAEQGAGSLRQALTEIRRAFGDAEPCLRADKYTVALDPRLVEVQRISPLTPDGRSYPEDSLFEGLDVRDEEFEDWLRAERSHFISSQAAVAAPANTPHSGSMLPDYRLRRQQLYLRPLVAGTPRERIIADTLNDLVARSVNELSTIEVTEIRRSQQGPLPDGPIGSLAIDARVVEDEFGVNCRMMLTSIDRDQLLWSCNVKTRGSDIEEPAVFRNLNELVQEVLQNLLTDFDAGKERHAASALCRQGIKSLFGLTYEGLQIADQLFERAFEIEPRGMYLAWRAYLRTYLLMEFLPSNRQEVAEEAVAFMYRALELEPNNSYVASFSAQVHSIVRKSHVAAFEMAERSIQLNRANPLGWACLGISECHLGKAKLGFEHTLLARELVGSTPLRFQISTLACIAATMAGEIDNSILLGEASHGLAPAFKPPMRFLSVLYLLRDQQEQSETMVAKLKITEPNFSYDLLRDKSYPASSLHHSKLLEKMPRRQI
jgi:tetratricopeptide (TPR) repeat protein